MVRAVPGTTQGKTLLQAETVAHEPARTANEAGALTLVRSSRPEWGWRWGAGLVTLAVFALYAWTLGKQSLWFDEGLSIAFAARPLPQLMHTLIYEDLHPPLYYLLLHSWMMLAGNSEWAVRLPSVAAAVLLVPLAFAVAWEIGGCEHDPSQAWGSSSLAAAALVGVSPFLAYYAQETRMYSVAALLALSAIWAYLRACRSAGRRWWLAFSGLLAAGLYTQYMSAFVLPAYWTYALLLDRRFWRRTVLYTLLTGLLYVPWVLPAFRQVTRLLQSPDYWVHVHIDPLLFLHSVSSMFLPKSGAHWGALVGLIGALLAIALAARARFGLSGRVRRSGLVFLNCLFPLGLTYAVVSVVPKLATRYAIVAVAPLYICLAVALYAVFNRLPAGRVIWSVLISGAIVISLRSTLAVVDGRQDPRDDARGLASYLSQNARANDALLLMENAPYALQYYYHGPTPTYGLHVGVDFAQATYILDRMLDARPRRVWLVLWHHEFADPTDVAVTELLRVGEEIDVPQQFRGYRLRAFDIRSDAPAPTPNPPPTTAVDAEFKPGLRLLGFDRLEEEGGRLHYVLHWQALQALARDYSLTLSLQDEAGNEYLRKDQALCTDYFLPPVWPLRVPLRCRADLLLPADLPPLTYRVYLKVLDPLARRNLDLVDSQGAPQGQALLLEQLTLAKSGLSPAPAQIKHPLQADVGGELQLLGFDLQETHYGQGDSVSLTLWWQRTAAPLAGASNESVRFRLLDSKGAVSWESQEPILPAHPDTDWLPGEVNRVKYRLVIPPDLAGGDYHLQAGLRGSMISLVKIQVAARDRRYEIPSMQYAVELPFEHGITLLGYDLSSPGVRRGDALTVVLYWQAHEPIAVSYKVSVQMLAADMRLAAQDDSIPVRWTYPTSAWLPGEVIVDEHVLVIQSGATPGDHTLMVALYEEATAVRLHVEQGGALIDHAALGTVRIVE